MKEFKSNVSFEDYQGKSLIEKSFIDAQKVFSKQTLEKAARSIALSNLENGKIDQETFDKAMGQLDTLMKGGEGSKGGHVIGHTSSGKPIYEHGKHSDYKNFHEHDHHEAYYAHSKMADNYRVKKNSHESLRRIAEEEKDRDAVKGHAAKMKEYDAKEMHHAAQSIYHSEEAKPQSIRDRYSEVGKKVESIRSK